MSTTFMHSEENKVCFKADRYSMHNLPGFDSASLAKDEPHETNDQNAFSDILRVIAASIRR